VETDFSTFLSLKAASLIPQLAISESGAWLNETAQDYAYALLLHVASENKRAHKIFECIFVARLDCGAAAWDILCERLDDRSFARTLSVLDNLMIRQRPG
jgi:hypothetical protein